MASPHDIKYVPVPDVPPLRCRSWFALLDPGWELFKEPRREARARERHHDLASVASRCVPACLGEQTRLIFLVRAKGERWVPGISLVWLQPAQLRWFLLTAWSLLALGIASRARARLRFATIKSSASARRGAMARGTLPFSPQRDEPRVEGRKNAVHHTPPVRSSPLLSPPPRNVLFDGIFTSAPERNLGSVTALLYSLEYRRFEGNRFFQHNIFPEDSSALQRLFSVLRPRSKRRFGWGYVQGGGRRFALPYAGTF